MARKKAAEKQEEKPEEKPKEQDPFIVKLQTKIEAMLDEKDVAYKDQVALIANAIKFLQAKHKLEDKEDGGSVWDD